MPNALFPSTVTAFVDGKQIVTTPWRNWLASLNELLAAGLITEAQFTAALLKILTALGSTDGTADTIIDFANLGITGVPPVIVSGDARDGFQIKLASGFGAQPLISPPLVWMEEPETAWPVTPAKGDKGDKGDPGLAALTWNDNDSDNDWPAAAPPMLVDLSAYAPLASPTFTGDPKAPTPAVGDNDTSIATTAFVTAALAALGTGTSASTFFP